MLSLEYEPRAAVEGAAISTLAGSAWLIGAFFLSVRALARRFRTRRVPVGS